MNDMFVALLAYLAQEFGGSLGCAIITLSSGMRVALLPLTIKLARRGRRNQEIMQALQPEIEQLKRRFEKKPERLFEEMHKLYKEHDCRPFDIPTLIGNFVQLPIFAILYSSIRRSLTSSSAFLWIKNLALPDMCLTFSIVLLTGLTGLFDAHKLAADAQHVDPRSSGFHIFHSLETGGWTESLLGIIRRGESIPDAMASLLQQESCFENGLTSLNNTARREEVDKNPVIIFQIRLALGPNHPCSRSRDRSAFPSRYCSAQGSTYHPNS
jgi:YidC/Oxa1 family membrane protein insertase